METQYITVNLKRSRPSKRTYAKEVFLIFCLLGLLAICTNLIFAQVGGKQTSKIMHSQVQKQSLPSPAPLSHTFTLNVIAEPQQQSEFESADFKATAYCSCEKCCGYWARVRGDGPVYGAAGTELVEQVSVAVDNSLFPFGTVFIDSEGHKYIAADTGSGVNGHHIDVYFNDHEAARQFGVQTVTLMWEA